MASLAQPLEKQLEPRPHIPPERAPGALEPFLERHKRAALLILTLVYFSGTTLRARARPFWFDEILTLAAATQPTFTDTLKAARAFDAMPPITHLTEHLIYTVLGAGPVAMRLPGMIGFWVFCLCLFRFASRSAGVVGGLTAMLLPFATASYGYSFEARCYGMVLGFGGLALACWQMAAAGERRALAIPGLALGITGAVLSHYYAVLIYLPLAGGEALRAARRRGIDWAVAGGLAAGLVPLAASFQTVRALTKANMHPWAVAHVRQYLDFYEYEFQHALAFVMVAMALLAGYVVFGGRENTHTGRNACATPDYEMLAAALFLAIPAAAITLALVAPPHLFVGRYAVLSIAGFALVAPMLAVRLAPPRPGLMAALALAAAVPFVGELSQVRPFTNPLDREPLLRQALADGPVVVGDGVRFLQLWYYAPPKAKRNLLYIGDTRSADRYLGIDTIDLNLVSLARGWPVPVAGYGALREFRLYQTENPGWLPRRVLDDGGSLEVIRSHGTRTLLRVRVPGRPR